MLITGRGEGATVLPLTQDTQGPYITRIIRISRYVYGHLCMHPLSNKIPRAASCMSHNIVIFFHFTCSLAFFRRVFLCVIETFSISQQYSVGV